MLWRSLGLALCAAACTSANPTRSISAHVIRAAAPPGERRVSYFVGGDSRGDTAGVVKWAFQQAKAAGAQGFIFLGDMEWSSGCDEHFRQEALDYLAPIPFYPIIGNHEVKLFGFLQGRLRSGVDPQRVFQKRFLKSSLTPVSSMFADKVVYSVDLQKGLHLIGLDNVTHGIFGAEQLNWLEGDLKRAKARPDIKHIVIAMHEPLADSCIGAHSMEAAGDLGRSESARALGLFHDYGVAMILASHVHQFAHFLQNGIPTYVSGGLGAHLVACKCGDCRSFHHMLQLDVGDSDIRVSVVAFPGAQTGGDDVEDNSFPDLRCADRAGVREPVAEH